MSGCIFPFHFTRPIEEYTEEICALEVSVLFSISAVWTVGQAPPQQTNVWLSSWILAVAFVSESPSVVRALKKLYKVGYSHFGAHKPVWMDYTVQFEMSRIRFES